MSINTGFQCEACGFVVPPATSTCRNHCTQCLASKHVDDTVPGDRASACRGLMDAIAVEGSNPEKLDLVHECRICGKIQKNKVAPDDSRDAIFGLMGKL
ncbi:MAG: RNHCP domain-containing protein [Candidatus Andersenbacteria bacterium]|nr:RNHCP domain-containing protein [Candidatus Andersenbacteria bacterium]